MLYSVGDGGRLRVGPSVSFALLPFALFFFFSFFYVFLVLVFVLVVVFISAAAYYFENGPAFLGQPEYELRNGRQTGPETRTAALDWKEKAKKWEKHEMESAQEAYDIISVRE